MSSINLTVDLRAKPDENGKTFYVGKIKFPGDIDCREGVTFLIFTSEEGAEQMQITKLTEGKDPRNNKYKSPMPKPDGNY